MKTVAVDLNPATREVATGTEVFTREVGSRLRAAAPELRWLFFASRARAGLGVDVTVVPMARLWSQVRLPLALAPARPDLLFVPAHAIPFGWPGRSLTVVHDLAFERHPEAYALAERLYLQATTRWAALRCPLLITPSESTKKDLVDVYHVAPDRVRVVPEGGGEQLEREVAPATRLAELGLDGDFVLQVGRIEARKNQAAALSAVELLDGVTLAVAGPERDRALAERLRWSCPACPRVSACPCSRRWRTARSSSPRERHRCPRLAATRRSTWTIPAMLPSSDERWRRRSGTARCAPAWAWPRAPGRPGSPGIAVRRASRRSCASWSADRGRCSATGTAAAGTPCASGWAIRHAGCRVRSAFHSV